MISRPTANGVSRRTFLTGGLATLAGVTLGRQERAGTGRGGGPVARTAAARTAYSSGRSRSVHLAATDGWASMPPAAPANPPFFPDPLAPAPFNTYIFGFRDVTGFTAAAVDAQRGKAQLTAPLLAFDEGDDVRITLSNLGLSQRPDLTDGHTVHWHGFVNAIPLFDGVPELSMSVPIGREFTYFYRPHDPGTYMYHCHFEDVEHVQMGMTGIVLVRPAQNGGTNGQPAGRYVFNDGDGSTRYDREAALLLTEMWAEAHYRDAHIQTTDWTDFAPSFWLMNGRAWPDTVEPDGDPMLSTAGRLRYQPQSSLVRCRPRERVLLRIANLGYQNHTLTMDGVDLTVVGQDASQLRSGATTNYLVTNNVEIGPGESRDVLFTAPGAGRYLLYDRAFAFLNNGGGRGYGGQMTQVVVDPATPPPLPATT